VIRIVGVHPLAAAVEHSKDAEIDLDGLAEVRDDSLGLLVHHFVEPG